jgi:hypothetical protein
MRLSLSLLALASLAVTLPRAVQAQEAAPPRPEASAPRPPPPEVRPARPPAPDARRELSPYPRSGPRPVPARPFAGPRHDPRPRYWWGWGWGYGWYPLYPYRPGPQPPPDGYARPQPPREQDRIFTRFSVYGAGRTDGYMGGLTFGLESRFVGFDLDVAALAREQVTGRLHADGSDPATWATAHLTWALISDPSFRLRLETGGSVLALPDSPATFDRPWRGKTLLGPDLGISGQLGLAGPVGIEGYARLTPFATRVADTFIGLTVHGGPLGVNAGWRWVDIAGDDRNAPKLMFRGPQVGLVLAF